MNVDKVMLYLCNLIKNNTSIFEVRSAMAEEKQAASSMMEEKVETLPDMEIYLELEKEISAQRRHLDHLKQAKSRVQATEGRGNPELELIIKHKKETEAYINKLIVEIGTKYAHIRKALVAADKVFEKSLIVAPANEEIKEEGEDEMELEEVKSGEDVDEKQEAWPVEEVVEEKKDPLEGTEVDRRPKIIRYGGLYGKSKKILTNNRISVRAIRRLARRGGVKRISGKLMLFPQRHFVNDYDVRRERSRHRLGSTYDYINESLKNYLYPIIKNAVTVANHGRRKTVSAGDVLFGLESTTSMDNAGASKLFL